MIRRKKKQFTTNSEYIIKQQYSSFYHIRDGSSPSNINQEGKDGFLKVLSFFFYFSSFLL